MDEDIDVTDINRVLWAVVTRCDPVQDLDTIRRCSSTKSDPMSFVDPICDPGEERQLNNRMVIYACRHFERRKTFPKVATTGPALKSEIMTKWSQLFPLKICK